MKGNGRNLSEIYAKECFEKIVIYPGDYDEERMKKLYKALEKLQISFDYEAY
ncbi:MAG: hypothetical protein N3F63_00585 [Thermoplasmata archaeon]|nr:hypothetical protein [Thermoplasmata archaeon]